MKLEDHEERLLRSVALQNAAAILRAQQRAEQDLELANRRITEILETIADGFVVFDREFRFLYVNRQAAAFMQSTGLGREQFIGRELWEVIPAIAGTPLEESYRRVMREQVGDTLELHSPMSGRWYEIRLYPTPDTLTVYHRDITDQRVMREALRDREDRLRAIFDHAAVGIAVAELDGTFVEVNRRVTEMLGYTAGELADRTFGSLTHPDDLEETLECMRALAAGEVADTSFEKRYRHKDGHYLWCLVSATVLKDAGGRPQRFLGVMEDISARRRNQLERERLTAVLERSVNEVYIFDTRTLRFEYVNEGARRNLGYTLEEMSRMTPLDIKPEFTEARFLELVRPLLEGRQQKAVFETLHRRRDGSDYPVEVHLQRVPYADDHVFLAIVLDITERRRVETELRRSDDQLRILYGAAQREIEERTRAETALRAAQQQLARHADHLEAEVAARTASLREALAQLEEFSYSVSHDLRAPIRAIAGYAQVLDEDHADCFDDDSRWLLDRIAHSAEHMARLVDDVLMLSRAASATVELAPIDLGPVVARIVDRHPSMQEPDATVRMRLDGAVVVGDEALLTQALTNLLANAVKFVAPGTKPEVEVRAERRQGRVRITVDDNGIGLRPEHMDKLFGMFQRLPTTASYEGTGIGLALVRKAAERMGGTAGAERGPGGSRFWIELGGR